MRTSGRRFICFRRGAASCIRPFAFRMKTHRKARTKMVELWVAEWGDQLAAYAMLAEHTFSCTVSRSFVYLTPEKRAVEVPITAAMRERVRRLLDELRRAVWNERLPAPTPHRGRCTGCEYRRFCGDVLAGGA